jgi:hypothetical protein
VRRYPTLRLVDIKQPGVAATVWKTAKRLELLASTRLQAGSEVRVDGSGKAVFLAG